MIARRYFAALVALGVLVLAGAGLLVWRALDDDTRRTLKEPLAVSGTIGPRQHLFGDPLRARIELILDEQRVDPRTIRVRGAFAPYRAVRPVTREVETAGGITRIRYDYQLACLAYRCLPKPGQKRFELRNGTVEYRERGSNGVRTEVIDWPFLQSSGRIPDKRLWEARPGADYRELGQPTYRVSPWLVQYAGLVLAILFGAAVVILLLRQLPLVRLAERLGLRTIDRRTPLERALARVHETADLPDEGRRALERLAQELRRSRSPQLAGAASQLAWSREFPADGRLTALSSEIERLIAERRA